MNLVGHPSAAQNLATTSQIKTRGVAHRFDNGKSTRGRERKSESERDKDKERERDKERDRVRE